MKTRQGRRRILKRMLTSLLIALGLGSLLAVLLPQLCAVAFVFHGVWYAERAQVRLLCETNHEVLLEACRELTRRVATGDLKPGRYYDDGYEGNPKHQKKVEALLQKRQ
jgi:hypothetical protein